MAHTFHSPKFNTPVSSRPGTPSNPLHGFTEDITRAMMDSHPPCVSSRKEISKPTEIFYVSPYYQIVEKITLPATAPHSYIDLAAGHQHFLNDELEQPKHGVAV